MSKIFTANITILILGTILFCCIDCFSSGSGGYHGLTSMMLSIVLIIAQTAINLIIGIVCLIMKKNQAKYYFLSMAVVVLIGVPLCFGGGYIATNVRVTTNYK